MRTVFSTIGDIPLSEFLKPKMLIFAFCLAISMITASIVFNKHNRETIVKKYETFKNK